MSQTITHVVCNECSRENEAERVYCHECGARLDRADYFAQQEQDSDKQKRLKRTLNPRRGLTRALVLKVAKVALLALAVSIVALLLLPPDAPTLSKSETLPSEMRMQLEKAARTHNPPQVQFSEDQINGYFIYSLKPKKAKLDITCLEFKRVFATLREGNCALTVERSVLGYYSVFTTIDLAPGLTNGEFSGGIKGAYLGRLPIHPEAARYLASLFGDVRAVLDQEEKVIKKAANIEFHDKSVVFVTAPPQM